MTGTVLINCMPLTNIMILRTDNIQYSGLLWIRYGRYKKHNRCADLKDCNHHQSKET